MWYKEIVVLSSNKQARNDQIFSKLNADWTEKLFASDFISLHIHISVNHQKLKGTPTLPSIHKTTLYFPL
jgi:hypothetical protein